MSSFVGSSSFSVGKDYASGGEKTRINVGGEDFVVHSFLNPGTTNFVVTSPILIEYLIVAGGGGGAASSCGGGGGAGGLLTNEGGSRLFLSPGTYQIVVGNGGDPTTNGENSSAFGLTAIGGGSGGVNSGNLSGPGAAGGSGGGASSGFGNPGAAGGSGTPGQGNDGGTGGSNGTLPAGAGGGGAGSVGGDGTNLRTGEGGQGRANSLRTGSPIFYAGGGAGGARADQITVPSKGGTGGGGDAGKNYGDANSGLPNTGGGGGGAGQLHSGGPQTLAGSGGSGIVVVRYSEKAFDITIDAEKFANDYPAEGGDSTYVVNVEGVDYVVHEFTSTGLSSFTTKSNIPGVEYLIVAGGGGGASRHGGGGGGGGLLTNVESTPLTLSSGVSYPIYVGAGGQGASPGSQTLGIQGENSTAFGLTSFGGGGGSSVSGGRGKQGGSGGGSRGAGNAGDGGFGFAGPPRQGYDGGRGTTYYDPGGGGGGAGAAALDGDVSPNGGAGLLNTITGSNVYYAGGGGGGGNSDNGLGGIGGGGNGGLNSTLPENGEPNTGGGGGGGGHAPGGVNNPGANGGSGIVVVRYPKFLAIDNLTKTVQNSYVRTKGNVTFASNPSRFNFDNPDRFAEGRIRLDTDIDFSDQSEYAFEFWVRADSSADFTYLSLSGRLSTNPWLLAYIDSYTSWRIRYRNSTGSYYTLATVTKDIRQWTQICVSVNSDRSADVYIDGEYYSSYAIPDSTFFRVRVLGAGYSSGGNYYGWDGDISIIRVLGRTLGAVEVKQSFDSNRARFGI